MIRDTDMSLSIVRNHFHIFKFDGRVKWLYNPVLKKRFKNRPEERVRLQWVEFLLNQTNWKGSRIGFETAVNLRQEEHALRADLILYDSKLKPLILIECKADQISLGSGSAEQAAKYNSEVGAKFVILSNGVSDLFFHKDGKKMHLNELPIQILKRSEFESSRKARYWSDRGFCGSEKFSTDLLHNFWADHEGSKIRYLNFRDSLLPLPMDHYYRINTIGESEKLAVGFIGFEGIGSFLIVVFNQKGINEALFTMNLDQLFLEKKKAGKVYKKGHIEECEITEKLCDLLKQFRPDYHQKLTDEIMKFF